MFADPPSFVISRWPGFGVALMAGATAALRCDVDANPPARAWWLRDDARTNRCSSTWTLYSTEDSIAHSAIKNSAFVCQKSIKV